MGISFSRPQYLALLSLGVYFIYLWLKNPKAFGPWQQKFFLGLRLILVLSLILSLAGFELKLRHSEQAVVYLADLSASVVDEKRTAADWIDQSMAALPPQTKAGVVSLGKGASVEYPLSLSREFTGLQAVVDSDYTDLAAGLRLASSLLPQDRAKHLVLLSDGKENRGDALEQAELLRQQGVRLDVVPMQSVSGPEALVKEVKVPSHLREGEKFNLQAVVESTGAASGQVRIMVDNKIIREEQVKLSKGITKLVWGLKSEEPGLHSYRVELNASQDKNTENNFAAAITEVAGIPKVLMVEGTPGDGKSVAQALKAVNVKVESVGPEFMPRDLTGMAKYSAIVLDNVPATSLTPEAMTALENYVRDLGRGLVMAGGEDSYGLGGYFKTPVEKALPVSMEVKKEGEIPSVGLALVIDKSGSMCHTQMSVSKMDMAKEAAIRATEILEEKDQLGVVVFDSEYKWVVETSPLKDKEDVQDKIGSIRPGGGTHMYPALESAYQSLKKADVKVKHIILLTDGVSKYGGNYDELLAKMAEDKITLTTVAVGSDSDTGLLRRLAQEGKGRYYFTDDIQSIPKIFAKETFLATRSYLVQEPFLPAITGSPSMLPIKQGLPPLKGYVATTPKETAEVILSSHLGDPVLARWSYGLGRAVAWTSDTKGRWAGDWINWEEYPQFWGKVIGWVLPQEGGEGMILSTARENDQGIIKVELPGEKRQAHDIRAKVIDPDGEVKELMLPATAPGQYQGNFPLDKQGTYMIQAAQREGEQVIRQKTGGMVASYSPEYSIEKTRSNFLAELAKAGGGKVLGADEIDFTGLTVPPVKGKYPLWPQLLAFAALLLPLDVASRRFNLSLKPLVGLKQRIGKRRTAVKEEKGTLFTAMQEKKAEREEFYSRIKETQPAKLEQGTIKPSGPKPMKPAPEQKTKDSPGEEKDSNFTSRLLAAKQRAKSGDKNQTDEKKR